MTSQDFNNPTARRPYIAPKLVRIDQRGAQGKQYSTTSEGMTFGGNPYGPTGTATTVGQS